jgi:hypothetical protein
MAGDNIYGILVENPDRKHLHEKKTRKAVPLTGRGGLHRRRGSKHFLDNRLTDGGEVISLVRRPPFTPQEDFWYSFLLEAESTPGPYCGWKD